MKEYKPQTTPEERANFLRELRGDISPERLQLACDIVLDLERAEATVKGGGQSPTGLYQAKTNRYDREELKTLLDVVSRDTAKINVLMRAALGDLERAEILLRRPTYAPKTTPIHRAELYTVIRQAGSGSAVDLLREVLQDLDMAEAALRGGGR